MLEYFTYKKFKKNKAEKEAAQAETGTEAKDDHHDTATENAPVASSSTQHDEHDKHDKHDKHHVHIPHVKTDHSSSEQLPLSPVLDKDDESWLRDLLADDGPAPPLPPRPKTPEIRISSDSDAASTSRAIAEQDLKDTEEKEDKKDKKKKDKKEKEKEKEKEKGEKHPNRLSLLFTRNKKHGDTLKPEDEVPPKEAEREKKDLSSVLDRLQLSAMNNKVVSLSNESSELLQKFTQVFKDLVNGVPTAYGDLTKLIEDRDGAINRGFEKLPSSLQKLVTQLPDKLTSSLAPEILAAAAESQGLKAAAEGSVKDQAKKLLTPQNLTELVTKPGAVVSMLKAIVNALKVRWPAFMGTNVLWSVALFLLMFVLWYCHKRGREVRLEKEKSETDLPIDGSDRIEELPDDPQLPAPEQSQPPLPLPAPRSAEGIDEPVIVTGSTQRTEEPVTVPRLNDEEKWYKTRW